MKQYVQYAITEVSLLSDDIQTEVEAPEGRGWAPTSEIVTHQKDICVIKTVWRRIIKKMTPEQEEAVAQKMLNDVLIVIKKYEQAGLSFPTMCNSLLSLMVATMYQALTSQGISDREVKKAAKDFFLGELRLALINNCKPPKSKIVL